MLKNVENINVKKIHKDVLFKGISPIWGPLRQTRSIPLKTQETIRPSAPKCGESGKTEAYNFRRQSRFCHFCRLSSDRIEKPVSTKEETYWDPVIPPTNVCHDRQWCPLPPLFALVGVIGVWDRPTPWKARFVSVSLVPSQPWGQGASFIGAAS